MQAVEIKTFRGGAYTRTPLRMRFLAMYEPATFSSFRKA